MKKFSLLLLAIDQTTSTAAKTDLIAQYLKDEHNEKNKLWTIALFTGKRPSRTVNTTLLRKWCATEADIPLWLFEQNYHIIGDLAETISLILPVYDQALPPRPLYEWIEDIIELKNTNEDEKQIFITNAWKSMDRPSIWVFNKLVTGGFRVGVAKNIIIKALSMVTGQDPTKIAYHLTGNWTPLKTTWSELFNFQDVTSDLSKPFPFYLAHALPNENISDINPLSWVAEWKWDGIRGQLIKRKGEVYLWSRGEELITDKFPEFQSLSNMPDDFVLDGEIVAWKMEKPMDFQKLQTRIGRKNPGKKIMSDIPVKFIAYDLLEVNGVDIRLQSFEERRLLLEKIYASNTSDVLKLSPLIHFESIETLKEVRNESKQYQAEGLMLKSKTGIYHSGRKTGDMWKWKVDPFTIDAVLIYAQRGHGRRANLFSDFTFALWDGDRLLPFAKAYSGLSDSEMREITTFVRNNTIETFGPVSSVQPKLVFELAFEGISNSTRHKSGIAVRFPRISRWRKDKNPKDADTLKHIKALLTDSE